MKAKCLLDQETDDPPPHFWRKGTDLYNQYALKIWAAKELIKYDFI